MKDYGGDIFDDASDTKLHIEPKTLDLTWDAGLWLKLNSDCGLWFDRFEATAVAPDVLPNVIAALRGFLEDTAVDTHVTGDVRQNLKEMISFCEDAASRQVELGFGFN